MVKNNYAMINHAINIDVSNLPKIIQNTIKELEEYEKAGEWVMYDGLADGLESFLKSALISGQINNEQFNLLLKKYRGGKWKIKSKSIQQSWIKIASCMRSHNYGHPKNKQGQIDFSSFLSSPLKVYFLHHRLIIESTIQ